MYFSKVYSFAWLVATAAAAATPSSLPTVDLGYQIHKAISFNQSTQVYNFSNIRYAQPPVGKLRFQKPVAPTGRDTTVRDGSIGRICPPAQPAWSAIALDFIYAWAVGNASTFNFTAAEMMIMASGANSTSSPDPRITEDCLFLDVFVPKAVFDKPKTPSGKGGAAVLVWIYGGGYTLGSKGGSGSPEYLINASRATGGDGMIFVELNYRLGALGWLAGPSLEAAGGVSNAALYDQRLAIEWVSNNIHLFGGDPNRITVMGESAGGGSIMHQLTAFGGTQRNLFQQAILQSPAWSPITSNFQKENNTQNFLKILGVSSIQEAQQASSEAVILANAKQVLNSPYGSYTYGPAVDGDFVTANPPELLAAGQFDKNVKVMVGHNAEEGIYFTDPRVKTDAELTALTEARFLGIQPSVVDYIVDNLYPALYNGSEPYTTPIDRTFQIVSEAFISCNTYYLDRAYGNKTYAYEFEVPPAIHGIDVASTFYDGGPAIYSVGLIPQVAKVLQAYIVNFVQTATPNGPGVPSFPIYGMNATEQGLNYTGIVPQKDPTANARCAWWQQGLYH